jgi:putative zinc finger/helix-turn-helix YgiT family protein
VYVKFRLEDHRVVVLSFHKSRHDSCGERLSGIEAARVRHRAICDTLGLLLPEWIREIRKRLGLTQAEFARFTGFGEATISRWERGRLLQNRANDRFLRVLAEVPESRAFLAELTRV